MFTTKNATSRIATMATVRTGRNVAASVRCVQLRSCQLLTRRSRGAQRVPARVLRERGFAVWGLALGCLAVRGGTNERPFWYRQLPLVRRRARERNDHHRIT